ncbi:MAG: M14 family zinc carboxypeptidase [Rhodoferax sp.]|nr:M14 family zinc carboxypeptidase [Rhodoferax sp.]
MQHSPLPALAELERILQLAGDRVEVQVAHVVAQDSGDLPVYVISMGNPAPELPAIGFFGGVHGLERIGTEVVLEFLHSLVMRMAWDHTLHQQLQSMRMVFMPLVNPGGMQRGTRANPAGVDLMRNAPLDAVEPVPAWVGGQRLSARLPWYRGAEGEPMQPEAAALCSVVERELTHRAFSMSVDCHSGFGVRDRLWFPYAHTRQPMAHLAEVYVLQRMYRQCYTHHPYVFEPQSLQYLTHGDLWDHVHTRLADPVHQVFLPLTLEMGSWLWIKKNPRQLFSRLGIFNPLIGHRQQRVLRRHVSLLDFLARAACSAASWLPQGGYRHAMHAQALQRWYE